MIRGRIRRGRPYVDAVVLSARLGVEGNVSFLIDTGSDLSTIQPRDAIRLGVDYSLDFVGSPKRSVGGVGGLASEFRESCAIFMPHVSGSWDRLPLEVGFAVPTAFNEDLPSLLGRDILSYYRLTFQQSANLLVLQRLDEL